MRFIVTSGEAIRSRSRAPSHHDLPAMTRVPATVGIVVPTHGHNPFLRDTLDSVVAQAFGDWALVIVGDGVADTTAVVAAESAAREPRIRFVRQERQGVAMARNRGLAELGDGVELVAFLDHDDRWLPGTLSVLLAALARAEGAVGAHGLGRFIDEAGQLVRRGELERHLRDRQGVEGGRQVAWPRGRPTSFANLVICTCIPVGTAVIRRAAIDRVGPFDARAVPADDYDMWLRLSRLGDFAFVDQVVMEYRQHPAPTWIRPRGRTIGLPYVRRKLVASAENTPAQAEMARQGYRLCERAIVEGALTETVRLARARRLRAGARQLVRAVLHTGAYLRAARGETPPPSPAEPPADPPLSIVLVSCPFEPGVRDPEALLGLYATLGRWSQALLRAGAGSVTVVQRFHRDVELRREGVLYRFVSDGGPPLVPPWYWGERVVRAIEAALPAVVHVDGLIFPLLVRHLRLRLPSRTTIVVQDHGGIHDGSAGFRSRRWCALHRVGLRAADGFFFTADELARPWRAAGILSARQGVHEILESSTDLGDGPAVAAAAAGESRPALPGSPALLWVGRLDANKDPLTVLAGFERLLAVRPTASLTMVFSTAELLPEIERAVSLRPRLSGHVHLRGRLPQAALVGLYAAADVFVLGSHHEGSGFALLEALSFGVTPVVSDIPAFRRILDGGRVGAFFPVGDAGAAATAMVACSPADASPEEAARRRRGVRAYFDRELAWPVVGERALAAYRAVRAAGVATREAKGWLG